MAKILLTGGAGYIGSHIAVSLADAGFYPVIIDNFSNSDRKVIQSISELTSGKFKLYEADCRDVDTLLSIFKKEASIEGVMHLAAAKAVGESMADPLKYYDNNIGSMAALLRAMVQSGIENLVFSSSCTVYGSPDIHEVTEETLFAESFSPYGYTKQVCERLMADLSVANPGMKQVSLRYFNPIGAHPSAKIGEWPINEPNNLVPYICQATAGKRKKLTIFGNDYDTGDGTCIRDYIHVCDLADAHVAAFQWMKEKKAPLLDSFNIGTGKGTSVNQIIDNFQKENHVEVPYKYGPRRPGDVPAIYANVRKAKEILNWKAKYTVGDALKHAWKWEQSLA